MGNESALSEFSLAEPYCAGLEGSLFLFDPVSMMWTDLRSANAPGNAPGPRHSHGFCAACGKLFIHGGIDLRFSRWGRYQVTTKIHMKI